MGYHLSLRLTDKLRHLTFMPCSALGLLLIYHPGGQIRHVSPTRPRSPALARLTINPLQADIRFIARRELPNGNTFYKVIDMRLRREYFTDPAPRYSPEFNLARLLLAGGFSRDAMPMARSVEGALK
jgi:hypothetical protein